MTRANDKQVGGDHYKVGIQPWDVMASWFPDSFADYLLMTALKYIQRKKSDKREDVAKAIHYLEKWLEVTAPDHSSAPSPAKKESGQRLSRRRR
jgi:hypothetical protein